MILFFDTETTGLPADERAPMTDFANWPRVTELAWIVTEDSGIIRRRQAFQILPDGWWIPKEEPFLKYGHSTEINEVFGVPIKTVVNLFLRDLHRCRLMVAHRMPFDFGCLGSEIVRIYPGGPYLMEFLKIEQICTREHGARLHMEKDDNGEPRIPRLKELYFHLFKEQYDSRHSALADTEACMRVFYEMLRIRHITIK